MSSGESIESGGSHTAPAAELLGVAGGPKTDPCSTAPVVSSSSAGAGVDRGGGGGGVSSVGPSPDDGKANCHSGGSSIGITGADDRKVSCPVDSQDSSNPDVPFPGRIDTSSSGTRRGGGGEGSQNGTEERMTNTLTTPTAPPSEMSSRSMNGEERLDAKKDEGGEEGGDSLEGAQVMDDEELSAVIQGGESVILEDCDLYEDHCCAVCLLPRVTCTTTNPFFHCERCGLCVHRQCYGIKKEDLPLHLRPDLLKRLKPSHESSTGSSSSSSGGAVVSPHRHQDPQHTSVSRRAAPSQQEGKGQENQDEGQPQQEVLGEREEGEGVIGRRKERRPCAVAGSSSSHPGGHDQISNREDEGENQLSSPRGEETAGGGEVAVSRKA